jgi:hypothetical protein
VGGGENNLANGAFSTVPGGQGNSAFGDFSFAAGRGAQANHPGAIVFADSAEGGFASVRDDEFRIRAHGGWALEMGNMKWVDMRVSGNKMINTSTNGYLSLGGAWVNSSDSNLKSNFLTVDPDEILKKVVQLPIRTWTYNAEEGGVRHIGPTAQDFYTIFQLGYGDTTIATIDVDGVALAAIQGLDKLTKEQKTQIQTLEQKLADLEQRVKALEGNP